MKKTSQAVELEQIKKEICELNDENIRLNETIVNLENQVFYSYNSFLFQYLFLFYLISIIQLQEALQAATIAAESSSRRRKSCNNNEVILVIIMSNLYLFI